MGGKTVPEYEWLRGYAGMRRTDLNGVAPLLNRVKPPPYRPSLLWRSPQQDCKIQTSGGGNDANVEFYM